jgi:hypothetical protein
MLSNNQQNTLKASSEQADVSARVLNAHAAEQTGKSDRDRKILLLVLLIMLLVITQVIMLLATSGVDTSPEPEIISDHAISQEDIKAVNDELKAVMKSLDETEPDEIVEVDKQTAVKQEKTVVEIKGHGSREIQLAVIAPIVIANDSNENKNTIAEKLSNYVKHDSKGESLADDTEQWTCVRDTETDLMWEVKSEKDALRNSNNLYSWYNPERKTLPGKSDGGRCEGDSDCDTRAYVKAMNDRNYCGYNDWYLPTREEMQTLVNLEGANDKTTINKKYFPHTVPSWYWTSSDEDNKDDFAWYVNIFLTQYQVGIGHHLMKTIKMILHGMCYLEMDLR